MILPFEYLQSFQSHINRCNSFHTIKKKLLFFLVIVRLKTHEMSLSSGHRNQYSSHSLYSLWMAIECCAHIINSEFHLESGFMLKYWQPILYELTVNEHFSSIGICFFGWKKREEFRVKKLKNSQQTYSFNNISNICHQFITTAPKKMLWYLVLATKHFKYNVKTLCELTVTQRAKVFSAVAWRNVIWFVKYFYMWYT